MSFTRRQLLAVVGSAGGIALAGCLDGESGSGNTNTSTPGDQATLTSIPATRTNTPTPESTSQNRNTAAPNGSVATAPIPDDPSKYTYATMGTGEKPTITYFGNWKCPACRVFSTRLLGNYVTEYIESGRVSLTFRALAYGPTTEPPFQPFLGPDAVRAARAGLIIWHIEPESYWSYHEHVFAHQPPERQNWATTDRLIEFAKSAGVKRIEKLRTQLEAGKYQKEVKQTAIAAAKAGISGTPQLLINGQVVSPFKRKQVRALINKTSGETSTNTNTTTNTGTTINTDTSAST
jgi:protein-disulfide isomerase